MLGDWGLWGLGWVGAGGIVCSVLGGVFGGGGRVGGGCGGAGRGKEGLICFCVCFGCYCRGLISGMVAWRWAVPPLKFEIFLRLPYFLRY